MTVQNIIVLSTEHQILCRTHIFVSQRTPRSVQNTYLSVIENTKLRAEHISLCHREHQGLCGTHIFLSQRTQICVQNTYLCVTENTKVCAERLSCVIENTEVYAEHLSFCSTRCVRKVMRLATLCTNRQCCCLPLHMAVRLTPAVDSGQV